MKKKISEVFLLRPRKHEDSVGIEFAGRNHGCQCIEVGVDVGGYDLFIDLVWMIAARLI